MSTRMTKQEREDFLAGVHVGIVCVTEEEHGPHAVPVWYQYEPGGELRFCTEIRSKKARLIKKASRFSICTQSETSPYKYVSVEGAVTSIEPMDIERDLRPLAYRYLGSEHGEEYVQSVTNDPGQGSVVIAMRPERWLTEDYGKAGS
ncbi:MAG: pyridoxamine 5'-phosphate oxidase family protein [Anaerolineaceae bacterium]|nr:pyridoxamine 5'-phosphate oxidase family protein [Anaerolineaceae bacterium]